MKILYSAIYGGAAHPFHSLADKVEVATLPEHLVEQDSALVIWGGSDINPKFYGHPEHTTTYPGGTRDELEWSLLHKAIEMQIPIIGVCRGAQMLCAAAGGFLLQDVHGHIGTHFVRTYDGDYFSVNSIHHQMMAGYETVPHHLIAWREGNAGAPYEYKDDQAYTPPKDWKEPEFIFFPKINGYAIQWHPEGLGLNSPANQYVLNFIKETEDAKRSQCEC